MKKTKLCALLLIVVMLVSMFAGCGTKDNAVNPSDSGNFPSDNASASGNDNDDAEEEKIVEIEYWLVMSGTVDDSAAVDAAINEITEREIGVHVNFNRITIADYDVQLKLAIVNNEQIDIAMTTPRSTVFTHYASHALIDITDLLDEYGQDIKELLGPEILAMTSVNGKVYGLTNYRLLNTNSYLYYREDVLESAGVLDKFKNMSTWAEFEEVMSAVKAQNETYAFGGQNISFLPKNLCLGEAEIYDSYMWDQLGDSLGILWSDQNGNVQCKYAREDMVDSYKMIADWYQKGFVWPDSAISIEQTDPSIAQEVYGGAFIISEYGIETAKRQSCGTEMICLELAPGYVSTATWGYGIPVSAKEPEAAIKFLNLLYQSEELMNLLAWGVEGTHYQINANGEADYLEGKDSTTSGYHSTDYAYGNQFLVLPWASSGSDFREVSYANFMAAPRSAYSGMVVDASEHSTLIAAITAANDEFKGQVTAGYYTEKIYDEFIQKLNSASIDEYVALFQNAVDEFTK